MQEEITLTNEAGQSALAMLMGQGGSGGQVDREDVDGLTQYNLSILADDLRGPIGTYQESIAKVRKEYALLDEDGEPVFQTDSEGNPVAGAYRVDPDRYEDFVAEIDALSEATFTVKFLKIPVRLLYGRKGKSVPGGGRVLMALRPFIDFSSLEDGEDS